MTRRPTKPRKETDDVPRKKRYRLRSDQPETGLNDARILLPTLQAFVERESGIRTRDLYADVAARAGIGDGIDEEAFGKRLRWTQQILKIERMVKPPAKRGGAWTITDLGRRFASEGRSIVVVPFFVTTDGYALCGDVIEALAFVEGGSTNAIWTSPPYPTRKDVRKYGTMKSSVWREWMLRVMEATIPKLASDGSMFVHLGQTWNERMPTMDTYIERFLVALEDDLGLHLLQRLYRINECALPGPIRWACETRERVKTSVEIILWVAPSPHPKASTDSILLPYAKGSERAFAMDANAVVRDSGMHFSATSFRRKGRGAIPPKPYRRQRLGGAQRLPTRLSYGRLATASMPVPTGHRRDPAQNDNHSGRRRWGRLLRQRIRWQDRSRSWLRILGRGPRPGIPRRSHDSLSRRETPGMNARPSCAHVGYTDTDGDYHRTIDAEDHLRDALEQEEIDLFRNGDYVSLADGRDFLVEDHRYDVVILHYLFQHPGYDGMHATSPLHDVEAWRRRLIASEARFIFAYGGSTEVSAGYLQDVPGYDLDAYDHQKAVYRRSEPFVTTPMIRFVRCRATIE